MGTERHSPLLLQALRDLAVMISEPPTVEEILQRASDYCQDILPVDGVGVLLRDERGQPVAVTSSSEIGRTVEQLEAELGEGPCAHAMASGYLIPVPDLRTVQDRYPQFVPAALDAGVQSVYALPLTVRTERVGAFDVVSREPIVLTDEQVAVAQLMADVTISYIANSRLVHKLSATTAHLQRALDSRVVIEQAKGTLAERHGIDVTQAFERMRNAARSSQRKLADVAVDVLRGTLEL